MACSMDLNSHGSELLLESWGSPNPGHSYIQYIHTVHQSIHCLYCIFQFQEYLEYFSRIMIICIHTHLY